jgi:SAM-dependent methyltransferase
VVGNSLKSWLNLKRRERGRRALERQLAYQRTKATALQNEQREIVRSNFLRSQFIRQRLERHATIPSNAWILEVGSGAHGLVFGFGAEHAIGVDPIAVEYRRLFPQLQERTKTVAAIGEELPFADGSFDLVLSDNVIDHAERPFTIIDEIVRVLRPGGLLYFTVNIHHPVYAVASHVHSAWNAVGLHLELSAFADHTVHLTETRINSAFERQPIDIIERSSTIARTKAAYRRATPVDADTLLKKLFFKNAVFELIAKKSPLRYGIYAFGNGRSPLVPKP